MVTPTAIVACRTLAFVVSVSVVGSGFYRCHGAERTSDDDVGPPGVWSAESLLQESLEAEYRVLPVDPWQLKSTLSATGVASQRLLVESSKSFGATPASVRVHAMLSNFRHEFHQDEKQKRIAADERAFAYLHQRLLYGPYAASCQHLRETLETGRHNCLTSTVLYIALCRSVGLQAHAVAMTGHVYVRITSATGSYDIETTSKRWVRQPPQEAGLMISDRQLLARVYYNIGLAYAHQRAYALSIAATQRGFELDPRHQRSRDNLLATLNNWALSLANEGQLRAAVAVISAAMELDADHPGTRENSAYLHRILEQRKSTSAI